MHSASNTRLRDTLAAGDDGVSSLFSPGSIMGGHVSMDMDLPSPDEVHDMGRDGGQHTTGDDNSGDCETTCPARNCLHIGKEFKGTQWGGGGQLRSCCYIVCLFSHHAASSTR